MTADERTAQRLGERMQALAPRLTLLLVRSKQLPRDAAEDAVAGVIRRVLGFDAGERERLARLDDSQLSAYLFKGGWHRYVDQLRLHNREGGDQQALVNAVEPSPSPEQHLLDAEAELERQARLERILRAVEHLEGPYREEFELQLRERKSLADVARTLGRKPATVRQQSKRGLALLAELVARNRDGRVPGQ